MASTKEWCYVISIMQVNVLEFILNGKKTETEYNSQNKPETIIDPMGETEKLFYYDGLRYC